jgi:hypothetical protein
MKEKLGLAACAVLLLAFASGCAITDYGGIPKHRSSNEAKLFATEISFLVGDPALDGTYAYTVKYDNRGGQGTVEIFTYRNENVDSFTREGLVDQDGDEIKNRGGDGGGIFRQAWRALDADQSACGFDANLAPPLHTLPGITLCQEGFQEEVDRDLDLQASFSSAGELLSQIWSRTLTGNFTLELTGIKLGNAATVNLSQPLVIRAVSNGTRPTRYSIDLTTPGGQALVSTILANTQSRVAVPLSLTFAGGMGVTLPPSTKVAFDHNVLSGLLN